MLLTGDRTDKIDGIWLTGQDKKGIIKNLQLGICSVFVVLALGMVYFNLNEIYSSVMILSGMMMVLSTPFEEARSLWKEH